MMKVIKCKMRSYRADVIGAVSWVKKDEGLQILSVEVGVMSVRLVGGDVHHVDASRNDYYAFLSEWEEAIAGM